MRKIYTIGHSTKKWEVFLKEIESVDYDKLVDVRSTPYSRWNPQYNKNRIIQEIGDKYIFMGDSLGGLDDNISEEDFLDGIKKLSELGKNETVVFFCSEGKHKDCHRDFKITPYMIQEGFEVIHL
ncbi:MAG: DUF488 domain-containing protein [Candidatus Gracilibacteria bacterium]|nr:DUF488 domain-containing protein [Candidatus Gracilibacteria bacterium]